MDPLNGAADIEARTLRLVSNYGFLEEPALIGSAPRVIARGLAGISIRALNRAMKMRKKRESLSIFRRMRAATNSSRSDTKTTV